MSEDSKKEKYQALAVQFEKLQSFIGEAKNKNSIDEHDKEKLREAKTSIIDATLKIATEEVDDTIKKNKIDYSTPLEKIINARNVSRRAKEMILSKRDDSLDT